MPGTGSSESLEFLLGDQTQNGHFCFLRAPFSIGESAECPECCRAGGPDWTRTSDPALIKRML